MEIVELVTCIHWKLPFTIFSWLCVHCSSEFFLILPRLSSILPTFANLPLKIQQRRGTSLYRCIPACAARTRSLEVGGGGHSMGWTSNVYHQQIKNMAMGNPPFIEDIWSYDQKICPVSWKDPFVGICPCVKLPEGNSILFFKATQEAFCSFSSRSLLVSIRDQNLASLHSAPTQYWHLHYANRWYHQQVNLENG